MKNFKRCPGESFGWGKKLRVKRMEGIKKGSSKSLNFLYPRERVTRCILQSTCFQSCFLIYSWIAGTLSWDDWKKILVPLSLWKSITTVTSNFADFTVEIPWRSKCFRLIPAPGKIQFPVESLCTLLPVRNSLFFGYRCFRFVSLRSNEVTEMVPFDITG